MVRYLLYISYLGTRYRGAQKSICNGPLLDPDSIQGALECGLRSVFGRYGENIPTITLSSRTDAGVHALRSAVHADISSPNDLVYEPFSFVQYMNRYMSRCDHDIRVLECIPVNDHFHARYRAISRSYMLRFMVPKFCNEHRIPIAERNQTLFVPYNNFNINRVKEGLKYFQGIKNFETFAAKSKDRYQRQIIYIRKLHHFTLEETVSLLPIDPLAKNFNFYVFSCKSKSFLYNQVRRMVGSLLALGSNKITEQELREMIEIPNTKNWNPKVIPSGPHGLYLENVEYDEQELETYKIYPESYKVVECKI